MRESVIQAQIMQYLAYKRIFHYRNNSGGFIDANKHFYRFGTPGSPDIIAVIDGQFVGIEVKTPKGKLSEHQKEFKKNLEAVGGRYIVAYSLDDLRTLM
jgi:VRR-NUC domain